MLIAQPSFSLLYILDEVISPTMTIKAVGLIHTIFGLKLYILYKIKDTFKLSRFAVRGQKNIIILIFITGVIVVIFSYLKTYELLALSLSSFDMERYLYNYLTTTRFDPDKGVDAFIDIFYCLTAVLPILKFKVGGTKASLLFKIKNFHTRTRAINRIGPHNQDVLSVLVGLLLGDGYANNRSGEGVRFAIKQSKIHKDYLFFLYNFFLIRGYTSNLEPRLYKRTIKGIDKLYLGYEFNTYTFRSLVWLYELFYKNGKKVIPQNISKLLTPLSLAILLADDGCFVKSGVRISLNAFTLPEIKLFVLTLKEKFNLDCTIQEVYLKNPKSLPDDSTVRSDTQKNKYIKKEKYSIYIRSKSLLTLKNLVSPHMPKSMLYKIGL